MDDKIEAKVTHRFAAPPERVYDTLLDPQMTWKWQEAWLKRGGLPGEVLSAELDPRQGGAFRFADRRGGEVAQSWGTFQALERPTKVSFTWIADKSEEDDPSIVTMIIEPEPDGAGSIVTLYNSMDAQWADWVSQTERVWQSMLAGLEDVISAR